MNVTTLHQDGVAVVIVGEPKLTYPILADFATCVSDLIGSGEKKILLDMSNVAYVDSATIGCLMDLYRQAASAEGTFKLAAVQSRVETMLTMTGAHNFLEVHATPAAGVASFGG